MAKSPSERGRGDQDSEVWSAISLFEQILEAMPEDQASLEALSHAYEQVGDQTRAKDYQVRLAKRLIALGDLESARPIVDKIRRYAADDPEIKELVEQVEDAGGSPAPATAAPPPQSKSAAIADSRVGSGVSEELALAWHLLQTGELTREEYAGVVQDLTELSSGTALQTVSVLHVLHGRAFANLEKIMSALAAEYGTPLIAVRSFDVRGEALRMLPPAFMTRRGAVVFEFVGKEPLVAILNPADRQLRKDVEEILNRRCHFYMTPPEEFDAVMEKVKELKPE